MNVESWTSSNASDEPAAAVDVAVRAPQSQPAKGDDADRRIDELAQLVKAYNQVTVNLQASHETLTAEVKRLQKQLASANAALQRSKRLAALGEMAAGIAHEVRNPLASIHLYADMLRSDLEDRPEQHDLAGRIATAVRGLDAIVNDVLSFAREIQVRPASTDIAELLQRAVAMVQPMVDAHQIDVSIEAEGLAANVDAELMGQALVNLVRNAVDAMAEGGEAKAGNALRLEATADEAGVQITVADTGPGISEADVDRIFNPFFTTRATGTGLGLAIVHRIVDAHGGTIGVANAGGGKAGAVFTLVLPNVADECPQDSPGSSARLGAGKHDPEGDGS